MAATGQPEVLREQFSELFEEGRQRLSISCGDGNYFAFTALSELSQAALHSLNVNQIRFVQDQD